MVGVKQRWIKFLKISLALLIFGGVSLLPVDASSASNPNKWVTVYLAGDSTVASYRADRAPLAGWGQTFGSLFTGQVYVDNRAVSGRSSKSFINEGRLKSILDSIQEGDYLFIQFGHNDAKRNDSARYTDPSSTFKTYLKEYVDGARQKGAHPILVTPMHRRRFDNRGQIVDSHGGYPSAVKELADELNVPLIDLHEKSKALFEEAGETGSKDLFLWLQPGEHPNYPDGIEDNTHFSEQGALELAKLVAEGLKEAEIPLAEYLRD